MPLTVKIEINRREIARITAWNCGHPATGERPDDDDLRLYGFEASTGQTGELWHRRSHGPGALASKLLDAVWIPGQEHR